VSFLADPLLLVGAGVALERVAPDEMAARRAERALLVTFLAFSVPVYLDARWTRPIWRTFRARSGRDFMLNSGMFHFEYEDPPLRTHIAAAAIFATYPLWLRLGRGVGRRVGARSGADARQEPAATSPRAAMSRGRASCTSATIP
jgi:hypothetical protein